MGTQRSNSIIMEKKTRANKVIRNEVEPLRKELAEYIDDQEIREKALERLSKIEDAIRKLVVEPKKMDYFSDDFGGQF